MGWIALHPFSPPITAAEERNVQAAAREKSVEFRDVDLTTPDGLVLHAWFMRPPQANGDAVILLHGVSDNRLGTYGYGKWLVENHYAVLIPDARGHGNSGGLASYGVRESDDIHRWVDWIEANDPARCVFGLGESMGAAELLQSLPLEPRFCAVVAESPFASFREVAYNRFGQQFHTGPWLGRNLLPSDGRRWISLCSPTIRARYGNRVPRASGRRLENSGTVDPRARRSQHPAVPLRLDQGAESVLDRCVEGAGSWPHGCTPSHAARV